MAIADAVITGNFIQAASGPEGRFLLPAALVTGKLTIHGERYDLGVKGSVDMDVPSSGNALRLATVPFRMMTILPAENAEVNLGLYTFRASKMGDTRGRLPFSIRAIESWVAVLSAARIVSATECMQLQSLKLFSIRGLVREGSFFAKNEDGNP